MKKKRLLQVPMAANKEKAQSLPLDSTPPVQPKGRNFMRRNFLLDHLPR